MRILVAGKQGQLARALAEAASGKPALQITCLERPELDIANASTVREVFETCAPDVVINAAAYTAVDQSEAEPDEAFSANETGAANLAASAAEHGIPILHVSTDYVFSGTSERPYLETDPPSPINVYGRSKLAGEVAVAAANPNHVILRTAWVHSPWGGNFVKTMLRLGAQRDELSVVADQTGTPSYAADLAQAILSIAEKLEEGGDPERPWGIFNLTNAGFTTWFGFAEEIFRAAEIHGLNPPKLNRITTAEYPTPARRPLYSVLDNSRIGEMFGICLRDWREATADCVRRLMTAGE